eukprot:13734652-Alexandrium_andersonii.AAC.1
MALESGLQDATELDERTPSDGLDFFKDRGNEFNAISARSSFMELYNLVPKVCALIKSAKAAGDDGSASGSGAGSSSSDEASDDG